LGSLDGRVAIVTGAGRGIGREEALLLAAEGAAVVVNDLGVAWDGQPSSERPAATVVEEIRVNGGVSSANYSDVATAQGADELVNQALREYGELDILINNAGILRDGMLFSIDPADWESVIRVHLLGHFLPTRAAARYWRENAKSGGEIRPRTVVCTSSESGLFGNAGQTNYDVAKMGLVSLTVAAARELEKYGVTSNAIAPRARTRMTTATFDNSSRAGEFRDASAGFDPMDPSNVAPFVVFLAGDHAREITGQVFILYGGVVARVRLPHVESSIVTAGRWTLDELAAQAHNLFKAFPPNHLEGPRGYAHLPNPNRVAATQDTEVG
jgi:NAD(P)-dependent dehydrogenase (short-subunit alcohol dehydrogenase family)